MKFYLSRHAQEKIERRDIPREFIESVLNTPEQIIPEGANKKAHQSQFTFDDGKTYLVRAIIRDNTNPAIVLTVYKTSQIRRYWKKS